MGLDAGIAEESGELLAQTEHFRGILLADAAGSLSHLLFLQISGRKRGDKERMRLGVVVRKLGISSPVFPLITDYSTCNPYHMHPSSPYNQRLI